MPIYDYVCDRCGESFEKICRSDETEVVCPHCLSREATRKVSCPSPLKKGAFPFKPGPVHPLARKMAGANRSPSRCPGGSRGANGD